MSPSDSASILSNIRRLRASARGERSFIESILKKSMPSRRW